MMEDFPDRPTLQYVEDRLKCVNGGYPWLAETVRKLFKHIEWLEQELIIMRLREDNTRRFYKT
jgi:hypothetical protein